MNQRRPRLHDEAYLAWLRTRHCVTCGKPPPSDPAHIRIGLFAMGRKPDDSLCTPLCRSCHESQHAAGDEQGWWDRQGFDPFSLARDYYAQFGGTGGKPKAPRNIKPRKPPAQRQKIQSRGFRKP